MKSVTLIDGSGGGRSIRRRGVVGVGCFAPAASPPPAAEAVGTDRRDCVLLLVGGVFPPVLLLVVLVVGVGEGDAVSCPVLLSAPDAEAAVPVAVAVGETVEVAGGGVTSTAAGLLTAIGLAGVLSGTSASGGGGGGGTSSSILERFTGPVVGDAAIYSSETELNLRLLKTSTETTSASGSHFT